MSVLKAMEANLDVDNTDVVPEVDVREDLKWL